MYVPIDIVLFNTDGLFCLDNNKQNEHPQLLYEDACLDVKRSHKIKSLLSDLLGQTMLVFLVHVYSLQL